jgi:hypothetical protein
LVFEYGRIQMIGKHREYLSHNSVGEKLGEIRENIGENRGNLAV